MVNFLEAAIVLFFYFLLVELIRIATPDDTLNLRGSI